MEFKEKGVKDLNTKEDWDERYLFKNPDGSAMTMRELRIYLEKNLYAEGDYRDFVPYLVDWNLSGENKRVLDIAGGSGAAAERCRRVCPNFEFHMIDISSRAINVCNSLFPLINAKVCNMHKLSYEDNYFDHILCIQSIEHCGDMEATISEIFRCLKNNGLFLLVYPYNWPMDDYHNFILDDEFVEKYLKKHGEIVEYTDSFQHQSRFIVIKKF